MGVVPTLSMELSAVPLSLIPLTFASAIVRYRLADVEVIVKRGLVWAAALAAVAAIYAVLLQVAGWLFLSDTNDRTSIIALLATIVVVLVARPLKNAIQATFDRAFYRDRYDYRRALVGFARDMSSDLDLLHLSDRIVVRVTETLLVDRMALLLADERTGAFSAIRSAGLSDPSVRSSAPRRSGPGSPPGPSSRWTTRPLPTGFRRRTWRRGATTSSTTSFRASRRRRRSPCWRSGARRTPSR